MNSPDPRRVPRHPHDVANPAREGWPHVGLAVQTDAKNWDYPERLSEDCVGSAGWVAMRLALGGSISDPETAVAVLRRAVELGVNHIDTAGTYGFGDLHAHELIRQALSPYPRRHRPGS